MGCGGSPTLPDYAQQSRDAVIANLTTFPTTYQTNANAALGQGQFQGLGDATTAGIVSDKMAQAMLDIQRNTSPAFIRQRLAELQAADPQGYAARRQLFDQILQQADEQPNRPLASDLQNSITQMLNGSGKLDDRQTQEVQQQVRGGQVGHGNYLGNAATEQEAAGVVGAAGQARDQTQQQALQFLQSGVSPEDVGYRRLQQSLGNLSSFVQGQTPSAQFQSLSGAQQGISPFTTMSQNPAQVNMNAAANGAQNALNIYGGQINWAQSQVNPWIAGLSTSANTLGMFNNLGAFNPQYTSTPPAGTYTSGGANGLSYAPGAAPYGSGYP